MKVSWRRLALVAALYVTVGVGAAGAQTLIVRNAPPGSKVELVLNATTIGSTTVPAEGNATLPVNLAAHGGKAETDAHIFVDVCEGVRRVFLVEPGQQPAVPQVTCTRRELPEWFVLRHVTTLVVDVGAPTPNLWLRQGPVPKEWLVDQAPQADEGEEGGRNWRPSPKGLVLFGGGGLASISKFGGLACGNVADCNSDGSGLAYSAGAALWITRFLAVEAAFLKPPDATVTGTGDGLQFDSALDLKLFTLAGKVAVPLGPVRIYGKGGANYHRGNGTTTQTIDDTTVTVGGVVTTVKGGTQTFELKTDGWGWLYGGGIEAWVTGSFALYGEAGYTAAKGKSMSGGEGEIDERVTYAVAGVRVRIGG